MSWILRIPNNYHSLNKKFSANRSHWGDAWRHGQSSRDRRNSRVCFRRRISRNRRGRRARRLRPHRPRILRVRRQADGLSSLADDLWNRKRRRRSRNENCFWNCVIKCRDVSIRHTWLRIGHHTKSRSAENRVHQLSDWARRNISGCCNAEQQCQGKERPRYSSRR